MVKKKRIVMSYVSLLSDTHFQDDRPISRSDDYYQAQLRKFDWCLRQAPTMLHAGDFFHRPKCSHKLLCDLIYLIKEAGTDVIVVPGQHDLIGHNLDSIWETPLGVLAEAGVVRLLLDKKERVRVSANGKMYEFYVYPAPFDCDWPGQPKEDEFSVLLIHKLILGPNKEGLFPGMIADDCRKLLDNNPLFDLIVSGDNHASFAFIGSKRNKIFNPGSMMRRNKDQINHKPCLGLIEPWKLGHGFRSVLIPVEDDVFHDVDPVPSIEKNPMLEKLIKELQAASCGDSVETFSDLLRKTLDEGSEFISPEVKEIIHTSLEA